jgi:hypothetical protein
MRFMNLRNFYGVYGLATCEHVYTMVPVPFKKKKQYWYVRRKYQKHKIYVRYMGAAQLNLSLSS